MTTQSVATEPAHKVCYGLADRVASITGGAQGIGAACVQRIAREGARFASDAASDVTGAIVTVGGGRMALNYTVAV